MANPKLYLPSGLTEEMIRDLVRSLELPNPSTIEPLRTLAAYHTIYIIEFSPDVSRKVKSAKPSNADGCVSLVLRVSGRHLPRMKTLNEVAAMSWVKSNTKVPIPAVIAFDATEDNAIGYEFTLLEKAQGVSVDTIYDSLDDAKKEFIVNQLTGYLIDIHHHDWNHAWGLSIDHKGKVIPGRVMAETFWQAPEIEEYWSPDETVDSLNPKGPYDTYTSYVKGHIGQYIQNILKHDSLRWMRDLIPRLESFNSIDLHFGNVMCDPLTAQITAILDWEFSAVLPLPLWSPGGGFLWNGQETPEGMTEQKRLYNVFESLCAERGPDLLKDFATTAPHGAIKTVFNYVRAIVEVCPRRQKGAMVGDWRKIVEASLSELSV
ncbi:hypothetical protein F5B20DRAFT_575064 [Whalleya microplaca]|nr:hypothetical protein F5B20DRAFT_575064 [Whalleya microplaca]